MNENCNNSPILEEEFSIGLTDEDLTNIRDYTYAHTNIKPTPILSVKTLNETYKPSDYQPTNKAYDDLYLIESGENSGYLYFFDVANLVWKQSILYEDSKALSLKQDKDMLDWGTMPIEITDKNTFYKEVSKIFATTTQSIYMFGTPEELDRFWNIWTKPIGLKATHCYIAIKSLSNKSSRHSFIIWVFASNYATPYFRVVGGYNGAYVGANDKGWVDVNNLDQETTLAVARPSRNNQQWTLGGEEVARLKGLRVWIKFAYNGNELVLSHDIRFPTNRANYQWYVSTPIPNPQLFSEKIIVQFDTSNDVLSLNSTGGSISADTQIIEVKGIE